MVSVILLGLTLCAAPPTEDTWTVQIERVTYHKAEGKGIPGAASGQLSIEAELKNMTDAEIAFPEESAISVQVLRQEGKKWIGLGKPFYGPAKLARPGKAIAGKSAEKLTLDLPERYGGFQPGTTYLILLSIQDQTTGYSFSR